ncbi:MAG: uroporphyrinogen-III C-methyltransferase [Desulfobacterales bacterium]|jgi:uroporphyrinogen III methyltransferase/synthase
MKPGKVYLIGAGPGDPGLITVKGQHCIHTADVVIYDYLAAPALLAHAAPQAEMIYVGKKGGRHTLPQGGINQLIIDKARQGLSVARLKGGDPYIFGRGGEEAEELVAAGIPFEVVPGVTSAVAGAAYAGIPLTHRDYTSTVAFVTGHEDPTKENSSIDWKSLATGIGTLVFFMGVKNLPLIADRLQINGMDPETPVALVRWGTTTRQKTVTGTLATIVAIARQAGIKAPALIVVGQVVGLRDRLKWFEDRPLFGRTIIVTRARAQASDLVERLTEMGANCLEYPTIEVGPPDDQAPLDNAIQDLATYDWLIFTSVNGVQYFFDRLFEQGKDVRALHHLRTAVIGPATAERLRGQGFHSDIIPASYRAEAVVEAFAAQNVAGRRILLPRAAEARPILPDELRRMGATVDEIAAYRTRPVTEGAAGLVDDLANGRVDMVTFTSSSTVKHFHQMLPADQCDHLMRRVHTASIGPITTETALALGFKVDITAHEYTIPGLCAAIQTFFGAERD